MGVVLICDTVQYRVQQQEHGKKGHQYMSLEAAEDMAAEHLISPVQARLALTKFHQVGLINWWGATPTLKVGTHTAYAYI
jgi:hypothetical protein